MDFAFTEDQLAFRDAVRAVLERECPPSVVRGKPMPPIIDTMILRCLDRDPQKRPASAAEIADLLQRL